MTESKKSKARSGVNRLPNGEGDRAMRGLVARLPRLQCDKDGCVDFAASDAALLVQLADDAETAVSAISLGISAIGNLMAYAAPEIEDGTVSSDTVEALGWHLAETGELAAVLAVLAAHCRRETADYNPPK
jgi:hypothetical protein